MDKSNRCPWAGQDTLYQRYHDTEWGMPLHDDRRLFEFLILEGAQAGLSWLTILRKRAHYRTAFNGFDAAKIAAYGPSKIEQLVQDAGIVRHRLKIAAAVQNARSFLQIQQEYGSFDSFVWSFVDGNPIQNAWTSPNQVPTRTDASEAMSLQLKHRGFKFVGATICYAYMQATGMVNDHLVNCFRYHACQVRSHLGSTR